MGSFGSFVVMLLGMMIPHYNGCQGFVETRRTGHESFRKNFSPQASLRSIEETASFPDDLVETLDLIPLVQGIADHAGTRRGRRALLSLVSHQDDGSSNEVALLFSSASSRRRRVTDRRPPTGTRHSELVSLASTADEARKEYELVEQATLALSPEEVVDVSDLTHPPIYGANSSPEDTSNRPETDDDEWMWMPVDQLTLEHVLQAEQVVKTLLKTKQWAQQSTISTWLPGLSAIAFQIPDDHLRPVLEQIGDAVEIARVRSLTDPNGRSTFAFRLRDTKFPNLASLRSRGQMLSETIDRQMKIELRKTKGTPEYVDYNGRRVLLIPKSSATRDVGFVRGTEEGRCYVEPQSVAEWGDELAAVQQKLEAEEAAIEHDLIQSILRAQTAIDASLQIVARLDTIFARAAFGRRMKGSIPKIATAGRIAVDRFVHPVLALDDVDAVVPTDLYLAIEKNNTVASRCLIISGPNGGGKSVSMKSFGIACLLTQMAVPIPHLSTSTPQIDFFPQVLVELGDQQNVLEGESTFMAKLNACSSLIQRAQGEADNPSTLVLLDEIGSGTDPAAGGAIGQAIIEKLLENESCRIVATTHSPILKALSFGDDGFECATVLLKRGEGDYKLPTFQLQYGLIGDSYALGAASRADPPLPDDVLSRAASLLASTEDADSAKGGDGGELLQALSSSLEVQVEEAERARRQAEVARHEANDSRDAMLTMARTYQSRFAAMEQKLETMIQKLQDDENDNLEILGNTLSTLRLAKKQAKTEIELLREQGLKPVSSWYEFTGGETVVVTARGPWEGCSASVVEMQGPDSVLVVPQSSWDDPSFQLESEELAGGEKPMLFQRHELAVWDYDSVWKCNPSQQPMSAPSVRESKRRLGDLLSDLTSSSGSSTNGSKPLPSKFVSSRERKAASSSKRRKKKGK